MYKRTMHLTFKKKYILGSTLN